MLPKIDGIIKKHIWILHSDDALKNFQFFCTIYKGNKKLIAPSTYPKNLKNTETSSIRYCSNCGICKNYTIFDNNFACTVTGKSYFVRGELNCENINITQLVTCYKCWEQYVGSAFQFKTRFGIHNSDIKPKKKDVEVQNILTISAVITVISFNTIKFNLLNRWLVVT